MVHRTVEAMSQLQEELVVLRERLALHDSDRQATTTQLQNQVPGEAGTSRDHCLLWSRSENIVRVPGPHQLGGDILLVWEDATG